MAARAKPFLDFDSETLALDDEDRTAPRSAIARLALLHAEAEETARLANLLGRSLYVAEVMALFDHVIQSAKIDKFKETEVLPDFLSELFQGILGFRSLVESPDRFARDLAVQLAGHDYLKGLGVALIPASAPDFFLEDTPTAVLVRQVLGAIAQFDKATMVAKLKAARDRKRKATGKVEGRKAYIERDGGPALVARVKALRDQRPRLSLREIAAELEREGKITAKGNRYSASAVQSMIKSG